MASATLLLPVARAFRRPAPVAGDRAQRSGRADRPTWPAEPGERAQLLRASSTCCRAAGRWRRVDAPARRRRCRHCRVAARRSGVRAPGHQRRAPAGLRPGLRLDARTTPRRCCGRCGRCSAMPASRSTRRRRRAGTCACRARREAARRSPRPSDALGADLFEHLPEGAEGRRWRALLSEAQVVLHNHPLNAAAHRRRAGAGEFAVVLGRGQACPTTSRRASPGSPATTRRWRALAALAGAGRRRDRRAGARRGDDALFDLRDARDLARARSATGSRRHWRRWQRASSTRCASTSPTARVYTLRTQPALALLAPAAASFVAAAHEVA